MLSKPSPEAEHTYATFYHRGTSYPVTNLLDIDGDATDDLEMACAGVVMICATEWMVIDFSIPSVTAALRRLH